MQPTKMRPTFAIPLPESADDAIERIRTELDKHEHGGSSISVGRCAELFVAGEHRRIWSPHLSIHIEEAETGSLLHGRFSPRPEIWTMLMFLYFTVISFAFFGAMLGCAQWMIDQTPWGLFVVPAGLVIVAALHVTSLIGQHLGDDQMRELRGRLDSVVKTAFGIESKE